MAFIEQFTGSDVEASRVLLQEQVSNLEARVNIVSPDELVPGDWEDEELAQEQDIHLEPKWKLVELTILGETKSFQAAAVVSPWLHSETGVEVGRHLTIIGKPTGENGEEYAPIGTMFPGRYEGDTPYLMVSNGPHIHSRNFVPWESADAALFLKIADQILPPAN